MTRFNKNTYQREKIICSITGKTCNSHSPLAGRLQRDCRKCEIGIAERKKGRGN